MNRRIDHWLILIVLILVVGGLLMVLSASAVGNPSTIGAEFKYLIRQSIALSVGSVLCTLAAITPIKTFRQYHKIFYILCTVGLIMCFIPGFSITSHGAARWLGFGSVNFQPSAFAKIAALISLAHYLHNWRGQLHQLPILLRAACVPIPLLFLILIEPDFGTTLIIASLCFAMLIVAGMKLKHIGVSFLTLIIVGIPILIMEEYRLRRVLTFWNPWAFRQGEGYQIIQSWIAMHQGGLLGQGLGNSVSKRQFLPEPWTDFIAAVIAEEMGFIRICSTRSGKSMPTAFAAIGVKLVLVIPGIEFISKNRGLESSSRVMSGWRPVLGTIKSARAIPLIPSSEKAIAA